MALAELTSRRTIYVQTPDRPLMAVASSNGNSNSWQADRQAAEAGRQADRQAGRQANSMFNFQFWGKPKIENGKLERKLKISIFNFQFWGNPKLKIEN